MTSTTKVRFDYVDVCKGIGILAVVIGHTQSGLISKLMYMFHMPIFFFLGGYLFKINHYKKRFFYDKLIQLLVPYLSYLFFIYMYMAFLHFDHVPITSQNLVVFFIRPFLAGLWLSGYATVFWFVPCFFLTQQVFNFICCKLSNKVTVCILIVFLLLAYLNSMHLVRIPWDANVLFMSLPIFYIGFYSRRIDFQPNLFIAMACSAVAMILTIMGFHNYFDMKYANYGIPVITLVSGLSVIYLIFILSEEIVKFKALSSPLRFLGECSMVVMYLHQPIQLLVSEFYSTNTLIRGIVSILASILFYFFIKRFTFGRALFIGSKHDFLKLVRKPLSLTT